MRNAEMTGKIAEGKALPLLGPWGTYGGTLRNFGV